MKKIYTLCFLLIQLAASAQNYKGKILYSHYNTSAAVPDSIYSLDSNLHRKFITNGFRPKLSHTAKYLAFSNGSANASYNAELWLRNVSAKTEQQIVTNTNDYLDYYDFQPSDKQLVYAQGCSIYTVNIDGSNAYNNVCTICNCYSDAPCVRYSDSVIVFHDRFHGLFKMNFDGSNGKQISNVPSGSLYGRWSADGKWIAYLQINPSSQLFQNIFKVKPDGTGLKQLSFFDVTDTIAPVPIWSADMKNIYFIGIIKNIPGIYKLNASGNGNYSLLKKLSVSGWIYDYWLGEATVNFKKKSNKSFDDDDEAVSSLHNATDYVVTIFPNPSSNGAFNITTKQISKKLLIVVSDVSGRKVYEHIFYNTSVAQVLIPHVRGMYFFKIDCDNKITNNQVVIE